MIDSGVLALLSGLAAQAFKVVLALLFKRSWQPALFFSNGGMPSSHSSTVTTLSLLIGRQEGFDSPIFSLVLVFSTFIIMEATGLRQEMGNQAQLLNELMDSALAHRKWDQGKLRELVGHTWQEVGGGIIFGAGFYWVIVKFWAFNF